LRCGPCAVLGRTACHQNTPEDAAYLFIYVRFDRSSEGLPSPTPAWPVSSIGPLVISRSAAMTGSPGTHPSI
jgi:hypothetical protein